MRSLYISFLITTSIIQVGICQPGQGYRANIMVMPWTQSAEDPREKLDNDFSYRAVLNEVRSYFDRVGFSTIDFVQALKNNAQANAVGLTNWQDVFMAVAQNSPADIVVQAEIAIFENGKYGSTVNILLSAIETSSAESLANSGQLRSEPFQTDNYGALAKNVLAEDQSMRTFLETLNNKFITIRNIGRPISIRIGVDENAPYDLHMFANDDGEFLSEKIQDILQDLQEQWVKDGLIQSVNYNIKMNVASSFELEPYRIPFQTSDEQRFDINNFARILRRSLTQLGKASEKRDLLRWRQEIIRNTLYLTLVE